MTVCDFVTLQVEIGDAYHSQLSFARLPVTSAISTCEEVSEDLSLDPLTIGK